MCQIPILGLPTLYFPTFLLLLFRGLSPKQKDSNSRKRKNNRTRNPSRVNKKERRLLQILFFAIPTKPMKNLTKNKKIAIKALLVIKHKGKLLLNKGRDSVKKETFYRFVGGSVKFGETAEKAIRREIREELNSEIENLEFLKVVENIFTYEGEKCHEIIFLYQGDLANKDIYQKEKIPIDVNGFPAEWVPISDILEGKIILYPTFNYKELF